jgi:hypothetical protein
MTAEGYDQGREGSRVRLQRLPANILHRERRARRRVQVIWHRLAPAERVEGSKAATGRVMRLSAHLGDV